jgi:hypothetical protein
MHLTLTTRNGQTIPIAYSGVIRNAAGGITGGVLAFGMSRAAN